jgi:hypothetical protein
MSPSQEVDDSGAGPHYGRFLVARMTILIMTANLSSPEIRATVAGTVRFLPLYCGAIAPGTRIVLATGRTRSSNT